MTPWKNNRPSVRAARLLFFLLIIAAVLVLAGCAHTGNTRSSISGVYESDSGATWTFAKDGTLRIELSDRRIILGSWYVPDNEPDTVVLDRGTKEKYNCSKHNDQLDLFMDIFGYQEHEATLRRTESAPKTTGLVKNTQTRLTGIYVDDPVRTLSFITYYYKFYADGTVETNVFDGWESNRY